MTTKSFVLRLLETLLVIPLYPFIAVLVPLTVGLGVALIECCAMFQEYPGRVAQIWTMTDHQRNVMSWINRGG